MAVYTKETALYDKDKIHDGIENAGRTASNYITGINSDGIFVHQADAGKSGATPTDPTAYGVHITDSVDIVRAGNVMASFGTGSGDGVRLGKQDELHITLDSDSLEFDDNAGNNFALAPYAENGRHGGTLVSKGVNSAESQVSVQHLQNIGYSNLSAKYEPSSNVTEKAFVQAIASDHPDTTYAAMYAEDTQNGITKRAWLYVLPTGVDVGGSFSASNMDHGTTAATSSIASNNGVTLEVPFNKTFANVPTVVCSLVDVTNSSGSAVAAHQCVVSASDITVTGFNAKVYNNGSQARKCKVAWYAMSD